MIVRFCENNKGKGKVLRRLEEDLPALEVRVEKCLGHCAVCAEQPMALVNGRRITARNGDTLLHRILEELDDGRGEVKLPD